MLCVFSLPAGLLLQGVDRLLVGKKQREEMRRKNYKKRCKKQEEWLVSMTDVQPCTHLTVFPKIIFFN